MAVEQIDRAVRVIRMRRRVGDHHDGGALVVQGAQKFHHFLAVHGIQVAGRLVGQDQRLVADNRPGHGHALLLAARKLARPVRLGRRNTDFIEVLDGLEAGEKVITSPYTSYTGLDRLVLDEA